MTKEEFITGYCERSDITREFFDAHFVALPCDCGVEECHGWAAVTNSPLSLKAHADLYAPAEVQ